MPQGVLAKALDGFKPRESQRLMAEAIRDAIGAQQPLVVEAGTGKTYAYLVPALRAEKKVIISTGSKALQDQLYARDLPRIAQALSYRGQLALLKGRANYLCLERMAQHAAAGGALTPETLDALSQVRAWASQTEDGDIANCGGIPEDSPIWPLVTSTNDNCLGSDCPEYKACFVVKARRRAMDADIVVVNHHLFLADMVVKESGFGELIPRGDVMIFDEAHQLPDIASHYFGQQLTSRHMLDLARDMTLAYRTDVRDMAQLQKSADQLSFRAQDFRLALGEPGFRGNLRDVLAQPAVQRALVLLDAAFERATLYRARLKRLRNTSEPGFSYWYECNARHFLLALTPLSVSHRFHEVMAEKAGSWIFTSATLSVNDKLDHFTQRLGLENANSLLLASPFDYAAQALLCVPRFLPEPRERGAAQKLARMLLPVIIANRGRCFFLCTSHQMMRDLAVEFRASLTLPVLLQGETSKREILRQFVDAGNAVLVATNSFWEGVDVRGDVLSCVIIDKLPFTAPDDPLLKARIEDCQLRGGDLFAEVQIPEAVIALKQGVGRLIRDSDDRGVLIICDSRLVTRPYGKVFLQSLPPARRTRSLERTIAFLTDA